MSEAEIHGTCHEAFATVRDAFEANFRDGHELGAGCAVDIDGERVVDLWGGHADAARTSAWERDTLVNVFSTTKGMTALCAHQLAAAGKLDVDAPVAHYWPEFEQAGKAELPVRYLMAHRAGLAAIKPLLPNEALFDWDANSRGPDSVLGVETRFGLGFMIPLDHPNGGSALGDGAFGHPGAGGSFGYADPERRMGFGYVMNKMGTRILMDDRVVRLTAAATKAAS